jgi:glycosyltransferase involved in cell wall biosynthesis
MHSVPRIALFHPCLIHGGIQRVFVNMAQGFLDHGFAVDMVQATPEGGFRDQVPLGVRLIDLNAGRALTSVFPLVRYLRRERPDAVVSGAIQTNIAAVWARQLAGVSTRLVLTEHNTINAIINNARMLRTRMSPFFIRKFYPWADEIVAVSQGAASDLASIMRVPICKIPVIYNPIIGSDFWKRAREPIADVEIARDNRPIILAVGRLHFLKDYPTLLRAFAEVRRDMDTRLIFLGDGEERLNLAKMADELKIGAHVRFLGQVSNALPYMKQATVFALSSIHEALPTVVIEALAVGLPVVATDCPSGPREILCDGAYGTLVPVGDHSALANALLHVLTMPRPEPMPQSALQRFEHEAVICKYLNLLGFEDYIQTDFSTAANTPLKSD